MPDRCLSPKEPVQIFLPLWYLSNSNIKNKTCVFLLGVVPEDLPGCFDDYDPKTQKVLPCPPEIKHKKLHRLVAVLLQISSGS